MPGSKPGALPLGDSPIYIVQPLSKLPLLLNTYTCSAGLLRASRPTPFGPSAKVADVQNRSIRFCTPDSCPTPYGPCSARSKLLQAILSNLRMPGSKHGVLPSLYHHARQPNFLTQNLLSRFYTTIQRRLV